MHLVIAPDAPFSAGVRLGGDVGLVFGDPVLVPEGSIVLSW
jgi:hypothetical protein